MSRITRIVPTTVLTIAALALVAPAAQAKPSAFTSGGTAHANPSVQSTQDANYGTTYANPSVQSTQDANYGKNIHSVVVTTGDKPLANPVKLPETLGVGLMHASSVPSHVDSQRPVAVPASPSNGFDWTAAAIGAGLAGILMLMLGAGVGFRRGQLAA